VPVATGHRKQQLSLFQVKLTACSPSCDPPHSASPRSRTVDTGSSVPWVKESRASQLFAGIGLVLSNAACLKPARPLDSNQSKSESQTGLVIRIHNNMVI
jgi:hypothetical protein